MMTLKAIVLALGIIVSGCETTTTEEPILVAGYDVGYSKVQTRCDYGRFEIYEINDVYWCGIPYDQL